MEIHPIDSGIIRCICSYEHDDGFTLQCERCNAWQHGVCVGISTEDQEPEVFLCDRCGKKTFDRKEAREKQMAYLKSQRAREAYIRRQKRAKSAEDSRKFRNLKITDKPDCFFNPIDKCVLRTDPHFIAHLPKIPLIPFTNVAPRRVSYTFQSTAFGLEVLSDLKAGDVAAEVIGEVDWVTNYAQNPINQYKLLGCPKPGVMFVDGLAIDSRRKGNYALFIQKSSTPNCRVAAVRDNDDQFRAVLIATQDIEHNTLLTIPWTWDTTHPIYKSEESQSTADQATIKASLAILREYGLDGPLGDFLPVTNDADRSMISHAPKKRKSAAETTEIEGTEFKAEFLWAVPAAPAPTEELPKKRLSLADYKKKRPSAA